MYVRFNSAINFNLDLAFGKINIVHMAVIRLKDEECAT
jgi:hypothetical protein